MINVFLLISLFSIVNNMLFCMENNENKFAIIKCIDGQVRIPKSEVVQFPFISPIDKVKVVADKKLIYLPPDHVNLTQVRPQLTAEMFSLLTNNNFELPSEKSFEDTFKLWKEADFLLIPEETKQKIVDHIFKKATTVGNFVDIQDSHIPGKKDHYKYDKDWNALRITNNRQLTSIEGIEKLGYLQPDLLWMYSNSFRSINLDHILKHFPKVQAIDLDNNKLSEIHATHLPSNFTLSIENNRLSNEQIKKLQALVAPLPWYKKMYNVSFTKHKDYTFLRSIGAILVYSIPSALIGEYAATKMQNKFQLDDHDNVLIYFATATPLALGLLLFDVFRGLSPYKPAEIIGADKQETD